MLLDVCLGTRSSWKILLVLSEAPGKAVSKKEIRKLTILGNKMIAKFLILLEKFEIILSEKIGKARYYKLNLSNPFTEEILVLIKLEKKELNNIEFTALNLLREFTYELTNANIDNIEKIILFGSYAKRTYSDKSDIDVAIISVEKSAADELLITSIIGKLEKRFKKSIQPHYFTLKEFESECKKNGLAKEILKDGIRLL